MPDIFYADQTVVTVGSQFSTDFRFARLAILTPVVTYWQRGPTLRFVNLTNNNSPRFYRYLCGPYDFQARTAYTPVITNTTRNVAL